jgi:hypothetical protein
MPCLCYEPGDYTLTGNGVEILENTSLTWFLTTDGLLGTTPELPDMPNGNLNQMFWKLLQNDGAIVNFIANAFSRTFGVVDDVAPAEDVLPGTMTGAPGSPTNGNVHTIFFTNFEVTYRYNGTIWEEVARTAAVRQVAQIYVRHVTVPLEEGMTEVPFAIPTDDDDSNEFAFEMDDLALLYINNTDVDSPVVGLVPGYNLSGATVRVVLSAEIPVDSTYELIAIFRRTTLS